MQEGILLKGIAVYDTASDHDGQQVDLFLAGGKVAGINAADPPRGTAIYDASDLAVSPGWTDLWATLCEPGREHQDDVASLCAAAAAGGFTDLAVLPNTLPPVQDKGLLSFIRQKTGTVNLHPLAAASKNTEGHELTEMADLLAHGAVAFTDGMAVLQDPSLLLRALQYLAPHNALLMLFPDTPALSAGGQMHEGPASTYLGMKGIPSVAEDMAVQQALSVLEYTGGKLHLANLSSPVAVDMVRQAKARGLKASCHVAAYQMSFTDSDLESFDTNLKTMPPFRSADDNTALWQALADGTVDALASWHNPQDQENKELEFDLAAFGMIGLETAFSAANTARPPHVSLSRLVHALAVAPRRILGLPIPCVREGGNAVFTIFSPSSEWRFSLADIRAKSKNTPFEGTVFKGRPVGTVNGLNTGFSDFLNQRKLPG